jgi:hypothetical protein
MNEDLSKNEKRLVDILKSKSEFDDNSKIKSTNKLTARDFELVHIEELTFEDDSPRKESLENIISSLNIDGINIVYLLVGNKSKVSFYIGVTKIKEYSKDLELDIDDIAKMILKPSIEGNFRGSKITRIKKDQKINILNTVQSFKKIAKVEGVPSVNSENEEFQGIDRLVDIMIGDEFALMVIADPLTKEEIVNIEDTFYNIHDKISPMAKISFQESKGVTNTEGVTSGVNSSEAKSVNDGTSDTYTTGHSENKSYSDGYTPSNGGENSSKSNDEGLNTSIAFGINKGSNYSITMGESDSINLSKAKNQGTNKSQEFTDKALGEWLEYIDETLLPRIEYGKNKGLFHSSVYLFANEKGDLLKLGNTVKSLFSGIDNNKAPLEVKYLEDENELNCIKNFQLPIYENSFKGNNGQQRLLFSKARRKRSSWLSTNELSVITSLPQKEVVGLSLKEEVEFGLNIKETDIKEEDKLFLGNLVKSGNTLDIDINIDKKQLNKHIFIAGVTGSGKTITCQRILNSANYPFMVIEPAKTEYRVLAKKRDDILVFTLGDDRVAPFRINPFEILKGESISSRIDMIKANIEAAFDMEAAIPQIIEAALYECYEAYGWDIATSKNSRYDDPFANGIYSFPTLSDLINQTKKVVENQGFDERLKNDYLGSIKARLQGLLIGTKGLMLNTPRSMDFTKLLEKNVILELEEIKSGAEKSLIMGFILINLNEALKQKHKKDKNFRHITLIEEAHRLLAKYTPGENPSKKLGVETFADMLAEVRKYGESLIIVDQIPNKLTPEVLKNTNTKIVHKLFASDDKEAIGNTMALGEEQKEFLSSLDTGRVIISNQDFTKPIQVQIRMLKDVSTTGEEDIDESIIREYCLKYYQQNYKRGIIPGMELNNTEPTIDEIEKYLHLNLKGLFAGWKELFRAGVELGKFKFELKAYLLKNNLNNNLDIVALHLMLSFYNIKSDSDRIEVYLKNFLNEVVKGRDRYSKHDSANLGVD